MKKIKMILLIIITVLLLINSNITINTVIYSINIFKKSIFPSLLPFFIISELLINYGFVEFTSKIFKPLMKLFKVSPNSSYILVMSMISGFPSSSKYTKDLYLKKIINDLEATKILMFSHFSNPLFIMGAISITFLNNKKIGLFILIIHYITNFIVGYLLRNIIKIDNSNNKINEIESKSFSNILSSSIISSFNTLFLILGTMIVFLLITNLINEYMALNPLIKGILNGILEMTGGISTISSLNISLKLKSILIGMILSFGGLSVHMQVKSIISDTNIKYQPYLIARLLHSSITGLLIYFLFNLVY